ncbi:MAG: hypothetical protein EXS31_14645 [Pedosphaera sp.]|nr:hypothetical protein [Pedosphaera sp.]
MNGREATTSAGIRPTRFALSKRSPFRLHAVITRVVFAALLLAALLTTPGQLAAAASADAVSQPNFKLRWVSKATNSGAWTLEATGADGKALAGLQAANWVEAEWQKLLAVHAEQGDPLGSIGMPSMLGTYRVRSGAIQFEPQFPLEPGVRYVATFYPARFPGAGGGQPITTTFVLPRRSTISTTVVTQIYPTSTMLPENLLKFYIHFSAPMNRGHIYDHIHLLNSAGNDVAMPFLEIDEELWNPDMTRLTLFIDPGRIKRGVTPLEEIGPALEQGKQFTLTIAREWTDASGAPLKENFTKRFDVGPPDRVPIDPSAWKIQPPAAGVRAPLVITFAKPLDHALAQRVIHVANSDGQPVAGECSLDDQERRWRFTPASPWHRGSHAVLVESTIEDLAGNNIGKPFDVDLFEKVEPRLEHATIRISFEVP